MNLSIVPFPLPSFLLFPPFLYFSFVRPKDGRPTQIDTGPSLNYARQLGQRETNCFSFTRRRLARKLVLRKRERIGGRGELRRLRGFLALLGISGHAEGRYGKDILEGFNIYCVSLER